MGLTPGVDVQPDAISRGDAAVVRSRSHLGQHADFLQRQLLLERRRELPAEAAADEPGAAHHGPPTVLLPGDSLIARGLARDGRLRVVQLMQSATGLSRPDLFDWTSVCPRWSSGSARTSSSAPSAPSSEPQGDQAALEPGRAHAGPR